MHGLCRFRSTTLSTRARSFSACPTQGPELDRILPAAFTRRGFVCRRLVAAGARFGELAEAAVPLDFGDPASELELARKLGLADLSALPRIGFKGPGTMDWLSGKGVVIDGAKPNWSWRQEGGALAVSRSYSEALILSDLGASGNLCLELDAASEEAQAAKAYSLPRYDGLFWFALSGVESSKCLAKLCGVDLRSRSFSDGAVAQTFVASLSAIVVRADLGSTLSFHLLGDSASAGYFWDCTIDAMDEFGGGPVGLSSLQALGAEVE